MNTTAKELVLLVETVSEKLRNLSDTEVSLKSSADKWSRKELIGHLIDSAANNHHRFIRAQEGESFTFPKYEQEHWVKAQNYNQSSWTDLVEFWRLYNLHLAQVMNQIPEEKLQVICTIGNYEPVTLGFLVEDYLTHLKHHLKQIGAE